MKNSIIFLSSENFYKIRLFSSRKSFKKEKELELKFESKAYNIEYQYKKEINRLKQKIST